MNQISNFALVLVFLGGVATGAALVPRRAQAATLGDATVELKRIADAVNRYVDRKLRCE